MKYKKLKPFVKKKLPVFILYKVTKEFYNVVDDLFLNDAVEKHSNKILKDQKVRWKYKYDSHELGTEGNDFIKDLLTVKIKMIPNIN